MSSKDENESSVELECHTERNIDRVDKEIVDIQRNIHMDSPRFPLIDYQSEMGNL